MIANIIDRRAREYRWAAVDVIMEPTWHDNSCPDADGAEQDDREPGFASRKGISVAEAIAWAMQYDIPMTLYIHDRDSDTVFDLPP